MRNCERWLRAHLVWEGCCDNVETVRAAAKKAGYTRAEIKAARKALSVSTYHRFDSQGYDTEEYYWHLPGKEPGFYD